MNERVRTQALQGLLLVDKPAGITSHDVVSRVRRALRTKKVGHAGTLDPFATGLLVCAIGQCTRLLPYITGEPKLYRARIAFGVSTNTDDSTGVVSARGTLPDWSALPSAFEALTGLISQVPPEYSAKHVNGERAYARARRGEEMQLSASRVQVMSWTELARGEDWIDVDIECGSGTYVRALARDLGIELDTVAHCRSLRRLRSGPLNVDQAVEFSALVPDALLPVINPLPALTSLAVQVIDESDIERLRTGRSVAATVAGDRAALVDAGGYVLAVAERANEQFWQPRVVLISSGSEQ